MPPAGLPIYLLEAPAVHLAHGRWGTALGDLGLRVALPTAGALIAWGASANACSDRPAGTDCYNFWPIIGGVLGAVAASALDAAWLSHEEVHARPAIAWTPGRDGSQHASYGLSMSF